MTGEQARERAVACRCCFTNSTWNYDAVCDRCKESVR